MKEKNLKVGDVVNYISKHPAFSGTYLLVNPNDLEIGYDNSGNAYNLDLDGCTVASDDERKRFMKELELNGYKWEPEKLEMKKITYENATPEYNEQFVTFKTAKLLKKNGFAVKCSHYYLSDGNRFVHCHQEVLPKGKKIYECPSLAVAMRWLRDEYKMAVIPMPYRYPNVWKHILVYLGRSMEKDDKYDICISDKDYHSFEEAADAGIQNVVTNIVEKIREEFKRLNK